MNKKHYRYSRDELLNLKPPHLPPMPEGLGEFPIVTDEAQHLAMTTVDAERKVWILIS